MRVITNAGPGVKHDIQRALNVRNLDPKTALTQEQVAYLDHAGSYEPKPRLKDMDIQGIDQVMIIPTEIDIYPWLENALGAKAFCRAYNEWAYEYTLADPERLFFAALIPMQHPDYAIEEVRRVAALGCRVALVRPMDALGNYPLQPKYEPVWDALEETGMVYGMHPFPAFGTLKPGGYSEQYSGAELIQLSARRMRQGLPALPQRAPIATLEMPAERDLRRALHDWLRGGRGAAGAPAGILRRYLGVVVRRLPPRRRRCLAGDRDDAEIRPAGRRPGQVPRRQCPPPLQGAGPGENHPRPRHRD
jgi:hypothetical protein